VGNVIEITVKVRDQASAETAAIGEKIRAEMKSVTAGLGGEAVRVPVEPDATGFKERVQAETRRDGTERVEIPIEPDATGFAEEVAAKIRRARANPVEVPVEVRKGQLEASLNEATGEATRAAEKAGEQMGENLANGLSRDSQGKLRNAMGRFASDVEREAAGIPPIKVPVEVPKDDFEAEFRKAMDEGQRVADKASAEMRRSFTAIESGSRSLRAAMNELKPPPEDLGNWFTKAARHVVEASNGFSLGVGRMQMMGAAALALAPALAAIPAVSAAVVVGAATMSLGFSGVVKALKDYGAASGSAGQSGAQLAATEFSNSIAIKNAQQAITDAKKQAAREAVDSAERIKSAQQSVVDAEQQAASAAQSSADQIASAQRSVADAAYSLAQAEQRLQDAQKAATDAQKAETQAREDAANQLKDLNNASADSHLAVERATLNVSKAQENLAKVLGSSLSTDSQKKDAALALKEAQQGLIDAQQRSVEAGQKADAANNAGVSGMQQVVQAQDAVTKANRGVVDAQHGVSQATQAQADAQIALAKAVQAAATQQAASAQSVAKAEQSLADAQRSADRQRQDSMEAVAKAEQNLSDTYKQQQLAAAAAAAAGGGAADKFAQDMAKLTPAGQAFVKQLLSMKDGAKQLSDTAQTAMLPGLTQMLRDSSPLLPIFNGAIHDMGDVIGGTAVQFGALMQSPAFQGALTQVLKDGAGLAQDFGDGLVGMTSGVMQAAAGAGPIVDGLGQGIKTLMTSGIPDFFAGLATNASGIGQAFQGVGQLVSNLAGPLGIVAGALVTAIAPAIKALSTPEVARALSSIGESIGRILIVLTPVITMLAQGLAGALKIVAPLLQAVAKFMEDNHTWIVPLAKVLTVAALAFVALSSPIMIIAGLLFGLGAAVKYAWDHFDAFKGFISRLWSDIKQWFMDGVHAIDKALLWFVSLPGKFQHWLADASSAVGHGIGVAVSWFAGLPGRVGSAIAGYFSHLGADFSGWIGGVVDSVTKKGADLIQWFKDLPGKIVKALGDLGSTLWNAGVDLIKGFINGIGSMFGSVKDKLGDLVDNLTSWKGPPAKDAVLLTRNGQLVIQGFIAGIDDQIPAVKAKLGGLTASLPSLAAGGAATPDSLRLPSSGARAPTAQGGAGGQTVRLELGWAPGSDHGDELLTWLRRNIRVIAGSGPNSVQQALGQ
jgi:phage-related protein